MVEHTVCGLLHNCSTRIVALVDAVAETHQLHAVFLILHLVHELGRVATIVLDLLEHFQNCLVSTTVKRTGQSIEAGSNGHEHVGLCGGHHANRRR